VLVCDREYSEAEYSQLADYQGRTPVNLMTIGEKKWWSDGIKSLVLDIEHIAERGTDYQVFARDKAVQITWNSGPVKNR
jgi:hypothetical protein